MPLLARVASAAIIGGAIFSFFYWLVSTAYFAFASAESYLLLITIGLSIAFVCIPRKAEAAVPKENPKGYQKKTSAGTPSSGSSGTNQGGSTFQEVYEDFANATPDTEGIDPEDDYFPDDDDNYEESVVEDPVY